ncbi:hypothetical protein FOG18_13305 [Legionella israelensis]|uniref:FliM/FliN family flagellar motor switch protein n=1 Tax=Legionella israelensis TaxID=454 RepID=UPI00117CB21C|nr:FliM/FliN family flagellar motor switch protein [Legionella israelensis]QDP73472.1 hypothetical protein FOG18_13305 [Legionella israelensis]
MSNYYNEAPTEDNQPESSKESPENKGFSSAFDPDSIALKDPNVRSFTETFIIDFNKRLSSFLGRSFESLFKELQYIRTQDILESKEQQIYSNFRIENQSEQGILIFEPVFLHKIINFLFGSNGQEEEDKLIQFGPCALKIAQKIAHVCLLSIEKSLEEIEKSTIHLVDSHNNPKAIRRRDISERSCQIFFHVQGMQTCTTLSLVLPEAFIQKISFQTNAENPSRENQPLNPLHQDLIDSSVDLIAVLPQIKLKLSEVMNLKSGDLIPISNPEEVELKLGERKAYKAIVGQANEKRVVKITNVL